MGGMFLDKLFLVELVATGGLSATIGLDFGGLISSGGLGSDSGLGFRTS